MMRRGAVFGLLVALAAGLLGVVGSSALASVKPKPVITGLSASPARVASGGTTTISASVSGAATCTLSSNKPVAGLPRSASCESGSYSAELTMPVNEGKGPKPAKYTLKLTAVSAAGTKADKTTSVLLTRPGARSISVGGSVACAVLVNGHIKCWGAGELGDLTEGEERSDVPVEVKGVTEATQVSVTFNHVCAVLASGHIDCWGENEYGQLGDETTQEHQAAPVQVAGISEALEVAAFGQTTCALLASGHVDCWGENRVGELGDGNAGPTPSLVPVEVLGISDATALSAAGYGEYGNACARLSTGHVVCWGFNESGVLGDGSHAESSDVPVEVVGIDSAERVSTKGSHSCAVLSGGRAECWGAAGNGELGDGTSTGPEMCESTINKGEKYSCSTVPVEVQRITEPIQVATGEGYSCALSADGHVECWGRDQFGELGDGEPPSREGSLTPVNVKGLTNAIAIAASREFACAVLNTGQVECWGSGEEGTLGDHKTTGSTVPREVLGIGSES